MAPFIYKTELPSSLLIYKRNHDTHQFLSPPTGISLLSYLYLKTTSFHLLRSAVNSHLRFSRPAGWSSLFPTSTFYLLKPVPSLSLTSNLTLSQAGSTGSHPSQFYKSPINFCSTPITTIQLHPSSISEATFVS